MVHVDRDPNGDRIDSVVGSAFIIGGNFHYTAAETMRRLGFGAHFAQLRGVQCITDVVLDASRKRLHVGPGIGEPRESLHALVHAYIGITRRGVSQGWRRPRGSMLRGSAQARKHVARVMSLPKIRFSDLPRGAGDQSANTRSKSTCLTGKRNPA